MTLMRPAFSSDFVHSESGTPQKLPEWRAQRALAPGGPDHHENVEHERHIGRNRFREQPVDHYDPPDRGDGIAHGLRIAMHWASSQLCRICFMK